MRKYTFMAMSNSVSIMIPTFNRSDFLIRALQYYYQVGFQGYICIGDSSAPEHVDKMRQVIESLDGKLKIIYRVFPNPPYLHDAMVMKRLVDLVPTPFAVYTGDDDFLIPSGLQQCVEFLIDHPEYSAVHGMRVAIQLQSHGPFGKVASAHYVPQPILESATALERWIGYMRCAVSSQYSVHRIEVWRKMYQDADFVLSRYFGAELLPCSLSIISGKIKELNCLSVAMQLHDERVSNWETRSMYSLIIHSDWSPSIQVMREHIVDALIEQDRIDRKEAQEIVDRELWRHIMNVMRWQYEQRYVRQEPSEARRIDSSDAISKRHFLKGAFVKILRRVSLKQFIRRGLQNQKDRPDAISNPLSSINLSSLLDPSSPFNPDFMPVYHIITGSQGRGEY